MRHRRLSRLTVCSAVALQLVAWLCGEARAQAVQAVRGTTADRVAETTSDSRAYVRRVFDEATNAITIATPQEQEIRAALERVVGTARRVLTASEQALPAEYREFARALDRACAVTARESRFAAFRAVAACTSVPEGGIAESTAQVPAIFNRVRDVVFTIG